MVKKLAKGKKSKKKAWSWTEEDVPVYTSLPPKVDGQLRCYLKLGVNQVLWTVATPPEITHVRIIWWGEEGDGAIFRPHDVRKGKDQTCKTVARYAIRSGPKQFASYLNDMRNLVLEVLSGPHMVTVCKAQIDQIGLLAIDRPINGFFPVFSADSEKVAEIQVSIMLEPLMASFDSMSTIPTPDMSTDQYLSGSDVQPQNPRHTAPVPRPAFVGSSAEDPFVSPTASTRFRRTHPGATNGPVIPTSSTANKSASSAIAVAALDRAAKLRAHLTNGIASAKVGQEVKVEGYSSGVSHQVAAPAVGGPEAQDANSGSVDSGLGTMSKQEAAQMLKDVHIGSSAPGKGEKAGYNPTDLLSSLLNKGNQLRQAMIKSTVETYTVQEQLTNQPHLPQVKTASVLPANSVLSGDGIKAASKVDSYPVDFIDNDVEEAEDGAIQLVIGDTVADDEIKMLGLLNGSGGSSISGDDDVLSDLGDPAHQDSILNELFYKYAADDSDGSLPEHQGEYRSLRRGSRSSSLASLEDQGNRRPPSRSSNASSIGEKSPKGKKKGKVKGRGRSRERASHDRKKKGSHDRSRSHDSLSADRSRSLDRISSSDRSRSRSFDKSRSHDQKSKSVKTKLSSKKKSSTKTTKKSRRKHSYTDPSDFDLTNSRLSESSALSFDRATVDSGGGKSGQLVDGLSVQRLTLLGRVHVARVIIDRLVLASSITESLENQAGRTGGSGRPPRPSAKKPCTFFVEYQFPVTTTSKDKYAQNTMATEVTRLVSKRVSDGVVTFSHRSVFPVCFDGDAVSGWWRTSLIFKVYSRPSGLKTPTLLGTCSVPLKSLLKSEALYLDRNVDVKDRSLMGPTVSPHHSSSSLPIVGSLKISLELASDSKDFSTALARTRLAEMRNAKVVPINQPGSSLPKLNVEPTSTGYKDSCATQTEPQPTLIDSMPLQQPPEPAYITHKPPPAQPRPQPALEPQSQPQPQALQEPIVGHEVETLHTLLMIPEGQNITLQGTGKPGQPQTLNKGWTGRDMATRNLYLVCRMFWCDDVCRSSICWGTFDPEFNFVQVTPVLLTTSLLERMRNNSMVVEVWDKKTSSENDQLVGMLKLPLHQLYMAFRDRRITKSLMNSQYPVICVDNMLPVVNPFSGLQYGQLQVLLAMGSADQVAHLQKVKIHGHSATAEPERPLHHLDRHHLMQTDRSSGQTENSLEHVFEVCVESIKGLQLLEDMIWGEADCFVQYHFPAQQKTSQPGAADILHAMPTVKSYRTATTLCVPDPAFHDVTRHKLVLPEGTPVQREILTACSGSGGGGGGVPFEVWCRYYYPNVRDQVIAKTSLPLAKLCAMVTMQKRGEPSVQTFTLPLKPVDAELVVEQEDETKPQDGGLMEVTLHYRWQQLQNLTQTVPEQTIPRSLPQPQVCIGVSVIRAAGLKAAASALARYDAAMQYVSEVGVNSYLRINLSFLNKQDERVTRTVARSFAPDYSCHLDFPCPLLWTDMETDAVSLAEILETAEATFEIWHQVPTSMLDIQQHYTNPPADFQARRLISNTGDILLGTTTVSLHDLVKRKTGIQGWYPVNLPRRGWDTTGPDDDMSGDESGRGPQRVAGGLELSIKFAHQEDLDRVVHAARGVGWSPEVDIEHRDWESMDECGESQYQVTVAVDLIRFPVQAALMAGQSRLDKATCSYIRYKLYDKGARCSKLMKLEQLEEGFITSNTKYSSSIIITSSGPFLWYLQEEKLEVQVWVTHSGDVNEKPRPRNRDKLIGAAYIDLQNLANHRRRQHTVSGVYPTYKPGAANFGGAYIRGHVTMRPHLGARQQMSSDGDSCDEEENLKQSTRHKTSPKQLKPEVNEPEVDLENTFPVLINIERATRLSVVTCLGRDKPIHPNVYVTYQTAEKHEPHHTYVFPSSTTPLFNHQHHTRLSNQLLLEGNKALVFKVWHKEGDPSHEPDKAVDRVLGFVSVDLVPLTSGFQQLCGWYNILDFNGQCQGQIKVAITPEESLIRFKEAALSQSMPATHTSQLNLLPSNPLNMDVSQLPHFAEHCNNVKQYHQAITQQRKQTQDKPLGGAPFVTRSTLFNQLRSHMAELDMINTKLKDKLHTEQTHIPVVQQALQGHMASLAAWNDAQGHVKDSWGSQEDPLPSSTRELTNILTQTDLEDSTPRTFMLNTDTHQLQVSHSQEISSSQDTHQAAAPVQLLEDHGIHAAGRVSEEDRGHSDHVTKYEIEVQRLRDLSVSHDARAQDAEQREETSEYEEEEEYDEEQQDDLNADIVVPKPLNNISAFNFDNFVSGAAGAGYMQPNSGGQIKEAELDSADELMHIHEGGHGVSKRVEAVHSGSPTGSFSGNVQDSFFGNEPVSDKDVSPRPAGTSLLDKCSNLTDTQDSDMEADTPVLETPAVVLETVSDSEKHHAVSAVNDGNFMVNEDPSHRQGVSRLTHNAGSDEPQKQLPQSKTTRQRRVLHQHRHGHGSSSSESESGSHSSAGRRRKRRSPRKRTNTKSDEEPAMYAAEDSQGEPPSDGDGNLYPSVVSGKGPAAQTTVVPVETEFQENVNSDTLISQKDEFTPSPPQVPNQPNVHIADSINLLTNHNVEDDVINDESAESLCDIEETAADRKDESLPTVTNQRVPIFHGLTNVPVPNFFMPPSDLGQTMRNLQSTKMTTAQYEEEEETQGIEKTQAKQEYLNRLRQHAPRQTAKQSSPPDPGRTQRIAKIFAQKYSK